MKSHDMDVVRGLSVFKWFELYNAKGKRKVEIHITEASAVVCQRETLQHSSVAATCTMEVGKAIATVHACL
jgi:hypothetical protein